MEMSMDEHPASSPGRSRPPACRISERRRLAGLASATLPMHVAPLFEDLPASQDPLAAPARQCLPDMYLHTRMEQGMAQSLVDHESLV